MIRKSGNRFPKRSCSNKKIERDDDSKKSHPALDCAVEIPETENLLHSYLRRSMSKQRVAMLPSKAQQQAIEAKLNFALGAETYDRLFLGFICGDVDNDTVDIFVQNEDTAAIVCTGYSWHVAVVVESVMKKSVKCVN